MSSVKKLVNDPLKVVPEMLEGLADLWPDHALLENESVIVRADLPSPAERTEVAVISGGGSGHEPAHAGYVGAGMLHAAVAGDVFTSPSADAVMAAIRAAAGPKGALLIVKNYTGDRLNFGLAAEMARAEDIPVEVVVVADDVSLHATVEPARRRGIAGTVLVHKTAGALAATGADLATVARAAREAAADLGTMGVGLDACTVPGSGRPSFSLEENEVELGLGIHGEKGVQRVPMQDADALVATILSTILDDRGWPANERVALLVNGLGGTPAMELAVVARGALAQLRKRGLSVERAWVGNLMTAIEMPGCSLTLLRVDDQRLRWLDFPVKAPAWPVGGRILAERKVLPIPGSGKVVQQKDRPASARLKGAGLAVAKALEESEPHLTALDSAAGDGDLGFSMLRGATALRELQDSAWADAPTALSAVGDALRRALGGSSGPLYAAALLRAARHVGPAPALREWSEAFRAAVEEITELGGAVPGDRTMQDALWPAAEALSAAQSQGKPAAEAWQACVQAAEAGAQSTAQMQPRRGRASYLGDRAVGTPDAGAVAVTIWLKALTPSVAQDSK